MAKEEEGFTLLTMHTSSDRFVKRREKKAKTQDIRTFFFLLAKQVLQHIPLLSPTQLVLLPGLDRRPAVVMSQWHDDDDDSGSGVGWESRACICVCVQDASEQSREQDRAEF